VSVIPGDTGLSKCVAEIRKKHASKTVFLGLESAHINPNRIYLVMVPAFAARGVQDGFENAKRHARAQDGQGIP
jgi:hypothetical protein